MGLSPIVYHIYINYLFKLTIIQIFLQIYETLSLDQFAQIYIVDIKSKYIAAIFICFFLLANWLVGKFLS